MKEVIEQLTPEEATELAIIEARIARSEDAALDYVTGLREIKDRRLYRGTHTTFEGYCQERWGKTSRAIRYNLESLAIRDALLEDVKTFHSDAKPVVIEFASKASESSLRELSKVKQDKRVDVIVAAHKAAKGKKVGTKAVSKEIAKAAHKVLPKTEPRRNGFEAVYGTSQAAAPMTAVKGKRVTLDDFRLMCGASGLNCPASATFYFELRGERVQVTSVKFNRNDNELVLS